MSTQPEAPLERFGTVLGIAPGNVEVYSSDYSTADDKELPTRQSYRSYIDDVYMGYKWQCVEFARRWLYLNFGYVFDDVAMAYDIFQLRSVRVVREDRILPLQSFRNGSKRRPEYGGLLIWNEGGDFKTTGHVAIVTEVTNDYVRIAEQNYRHRLWPEGQNWSRQIEIEVTPDGGYQLKCPTGDRAILGWVLQTSDATHAEAIVAPEPRLFAVQARRVTTKPRSATDWIDVAKPTEAAYVNSVGGPWLTEDPANQDLYYCISETAHAELKRATNELHALFMHATERVLQDESLLEKFKLPRALWDKIRQSWGNRRNQMITGRFDFTLSERGLKMYEYNCDSASCHFETGRLQGDWARHFACDDGEDAGAMLFGFLRDAWLHSDVDSTLHIMRDRDLEESYHALYMQEAMTAAGVRSKIIQGVKGLSWADDGGILDSDGERIRWVWKTWSWETALDQLRAECEDDEIQLRNAAPVREHKEPPRLVDVLLRPEIMVYEPLWTMIPSNKAILPVLWSLFPEFPYLLNSSFELTDELRRTGYAEKPIVGRCGANIRIYGRNDQLRAETEGAFDDRDMMYQQLAPLPVIAGLYVQLNTFSVAGRYAGACTRVDKSMVIVGKSDCIPLRIVDDQSLG
ncbi:MAG: bifunctional glutathionylspermidine amidase/synthase [Gammaproteobacteria bacterium]|nr:bifunctional glutathionylspermidine amidase/synthase [Gammaproteobacteria bacterium]